MESRQLCSAHFKVQLLKLKSAFSSANFKAQTYFLTISLKLVLQKKKIQDNLKGTIGTCRTPAPLAVPPLAERTPTARSTDRWELKSKPGFNMDHMITLTGQPDMPMYPRIHPVSEPNRRLLRALRESQLPGAHPPTDRSLQSNTLRSRNDLQCAGRECDLQMSRRVLPQP